MPDLDARRSPAKLLTRVAVAGAALAIVLIGAYALLTLLTRDTFDVTHTHAGIRTLVVEDDAGLVTLTGGPAGSAVRVVEHVTRGLEAPRRRAVREPGGVLKLSAHCAHLLPGRCEVAYRIAVPEDARVVVRSGAGAVQATDLASNAPVSLSSGAGDVTVRDIRAPAVTLETAAGEVKASGLDAPVIAARSAAGGVAVRTDRVPTALRAHSNAGSVAVDVPHAVYALETSARGGTVVDDSVPSDDDAPRTLSATSDAGDVVVTIRR